MYEEFTDLDHEQARLYMASTEPQRVRRFIAGLIAGGKVLDAGCGNGVDAPLYSPAQYLGVDISPALISAARELHPKHLFVVRDLTRLHFDDGAWQHVMCKSVLVHVPTEATCLAILRELCRVASECVWVAWAGSPWTGGGPTEHRKVIGHFGRPVYQHSYERKKLLDVLPQVPTVEFVDGFELWEIRK